MRFVIALTSIACLAFAPAAVATKVFVSEWSSVEISPGRLRAVGVIGGSDVPIEVDGSLSNDRLIALELRARGLVATVPAEELQQLPEVDAAKLLVLEEACNAWAMIRRPGDAPSAPAIGGLCHMLTIPARSSSSTDAILIYGIQFEKGRFKRIRSFLQPQR